MRLPSLSNSASLETFSHCTFGLAVLTHVYTGKAVTPSLRHPRALSHLERKGSGLRGHPIPNVFGKTRCSNVSPAWLTASYQDDVAITPSKKVTSLPLGTQLPVMLPENNLPITAPLPVSIQERWKVPTACHAAEKSFFLEC